MKIGIVSFAHGHAASYARALKVLEHVEIAGIYDEEAERGQRAAKRYETDYHSSLASLLSTEIDAVIICSENVYHHEHVLAAANAGKHILCEKPLATNKPDAVEMIERCHQHNVILQIAFPVRFHPAIVEVTKLVSTGDLGQILAIKGTNRGTNPGGWFVNRELAGGGAVIDHTVHVVDVMRSMMKAEVTEVYAEVERAFSDVEIDDAGILTMEFSNGVVASLDCSWSRNASFPTWGDVTMEVVGTKGSISIDTFGQHLEEYSNSTGYKYRYWGDDMNAALIRDFVTNAAEATPPAVSGYDGLKALEVALAAYQSAKYHTPVKIEK